MVQASVKCLKTILFGTRTAYGCLKTGLHTLTQIRVHFIFLMSHFYFTETLKEWLTSPNVIKILKN